METMIRLLIISKSIFQTGFWQHCSLFQFFYRLPRNYILSIKLCICRNSFFVKTDPKAPGVGDLWAMPIKMCKFPALNVTVVQVFIFLQHDQVGTTLRLLDSCTKLVLFLNTLYLENSFHGFLTGILKKPQNLKFNPKQPRRWLIENLILLQQWKGRKF